MPDPYGAVAIQIEFELMSTVRSAGENRWIVHMGSADESEVTVEMHMSLKMAERIAEHETQRIAALNPGRDDLEPETVGSAVLSALDRFAAGRST